MTESCKKNELILGMKIGLGDWISKLVKSNLSISACEIYFKVSNFSSYKPLFHFLRKKKIYTGLHFSSMLSKNISPNFATDNKAIHLESIILLQKNIDIAADCQFNYVVYHPGSEKIWGIDENRKVFLTDGVTSEVRAKKIFLETAHKLQDYAQKKGIKLFAETLPRKLLSYEFAELTSRNITFDVGFISFDTLLSVAKSGCEICNDICHTIAGINSNDPEFLQQELLRRSKLLLPYTGLVHLATVKPPFNGADDNGSFLQQDFAQGAIPTLEKTKELLKLFDNRRKIVLIPEPILDTQIQIINFQALSEIMP